MHHPPSIVQHFRPGDDAKPAKRRRTEKKHQLLDEVFAESGREQLSRWRLQLVNLMTVEPMVFHIKAVVVSVSSEPVIHAQNLIQNMEHKRNAEVKNTCGAMFVDETALSVLTTGKAKEIKQFVVSQ